jgi:dihydrofolate synthase/folylpolyglutamate synthase
MRNHPVLSELARFGVRMGLDRMQDFLSHLGSPHRAVPVIHVAGTNGKGSTVRILGSVLRQAGYRVGEYTSPHLQHVNERIRIDGSPISDANLLGLLDELAAARLDWANGLDEGLQAERVLTYFELMTAAAFVAFSQAKLDVVVVEVGLGGRLDATNVVDPLMTIITSIGIDHTAQLGLDLGSIASEKAGIIKPGVPVVLGHVPQEAGRVIRAIAHERGSLLVRAEEDFMVSGARDGSFSWSHCGRVEHGLSVGIPGDHQMLNAGLALTALAMLADRFPVLDWADVVAGLTAATHPGRLERLEPDLLVDCAHNVDGASTLAEYLRGLPRDSERTLLLGASGDKDARSLMGPLAAQVDRVLTTHCSHPRATSAGDLAQSLVGVRVPVLPAGPIENALPLAREGGGLVIVAGSVFLAGAVRELVGVQ